jgi:hypothetical protein
MRQGEVKLGACRGRDEEAKKTGANSSGSAGRTVKQKSVARKVQLVNKFAASVNKWPVLGAKYIMTGLNVAFRIPGDSFVPDKIDHQLTASLPNFAAGLTRVVFAARLRAQEGHNK